jgi:galactokinase
VTADFGANRLRHVCGEFESLYGRRPQWMASAPGRLNVIGEFTDYNDGFVLPMALHCRTTIVAAPGVPNRITVRSRLTGEDLILPISEKFDPDPLGSWTNYLKGVLAGFLEAGLRPRGFDALIDSDVPVGAGLSSSAALEVAFLTLLEKSCERMLDPIEKALLCQRAEHRYAQVPCGIMDPFIAICGRAGELMLLDCRSREPVWLPFDDSAVTLLVVNTRVKHELATNEYATRREQCRSAARALGVSSLRDVSLDTVLDHGERMESVAFRRARHVVTENARTVQAAQCVREQDWVELGQLLDASHRSLKEDYEVSCHELDLVAEIAHSIGIGGGIFGCRMTGGGFGGCAVALIDAARVESIEREIRARYQDRTGVTPDLMQARPDGGARFSEILR